MSLCSTQHDAPVNDDAVTTGRTFDDVGEVSDDEEEFRSMDYACGIRIQLGSTHCENLQVVMAEAYLTILTRIVVLQEIFVHRRAKIDFSQKSNPLKLEDDGG